MILQIKIKKNKRINLNFSNDKKQVHLDELVMKKSCFFLIHNNIKYFI